MDKEPDIRSMTAEELRSHYKKKRLAEKDTSEKEKKLLEEMFVFPDGEKAELVTISKRKNKWVYICHLCDLKPKHWQAFISHAEGKSHREMFLKPPLTKERFGVRLVNSVDNKEIFLMPGMAEDKYTIFSKANYDYEEPLIGTEYIVELVQKQPVFDWVSACRTAKYICLLCDEEGNFEFIRQHISTPDHCWTYLDRFFPKAVKRIECMNYDDDVKEKIMKHLIAKVEYDYGRLKVSQILEHAFPKIRSVVFDKIEKDRHLREIFTRDYTACVNTSHLNNSVCPVGWLRRMAESHQKGKQHLLVPPPLANLPPLIRRKTTVEKPVEQDIVKKDSGERYKGTDADSASQQSNNKRRNDAEVDSSNPNKKPFFVRHPQGYTNDGEFNRFNKDNKNQPYKENPTGSFDGPRHSLYKRDQNTFPSQSYKSSNQDDKNTKDQNVSQSEEDGIIPVLRILSILETELGSLGKKVMELLQEALRLERASTGGAEVLITREEIVLETIKEKLIGLLDLQMVNNTLVDVTNRSIKKIESLLSKQVNKDAFQNKNAGSDKTQSSTKMPEQKCDSSEISERTYASTERSQQKTESSHYFNNPQNSNNFYSRREKNYNDSSEYRDNSYWSQQRRNMDSGRGGYYQSMDRTFQEPRGDRYHYYK